ncbi:hypothetical protein [Klebsiella pneumoniae]|uniref:hypothetical protein n=1 Tax=Klebsiella pneumoniae TaxID=573 RepID=UPI001E2FEED6|nr:hypothetical protein [Klebsiella pneumoniae]
MEEQGDKKFNTGDDVKYYYVLALLLGYSSCVLAEECMDNSNIDSLREVFKNNKKLLIEMSSKEMRRYVESDLLIKINTVHLSMYLRFTMAGEWTKNQSILLTHRQFSQMKSVCMECIFCTTRVY